MSESVIAEAVACFKEGKLSQAQVLIDGQLAAGSDSSQLLYVRGLIHCRQGDLEAGTRFLQRAVDAEPGNLQFKLMLIRALIDHGEYSSALALADTRDDHGAMPLPFWQARAEAADGLGDAALAEESWRKVAEGRPADWRAWHNLGNARAILDDWQGAADALIESAALNKNDAGLRRNIATALSKSGRLSESVDALEDVARLDPADLESRLLRSQLLLSLERNSEALLAADEADEIERGRIDVAMQRGKSLVALIRFDEAEEVYREVVAKDPTNIDAVRELGLLLERTSSLAALQALLDGAIAAGLQPGELNYLQAILALRNKKPDDALAYLSNEPPDRDPVRWHRLMGKIADARGDFAQAFQEAETMNKAVANYDAWRNRAAAFRDRVGRLHSMLTPEWVRSLPRLESGDQRQSPVFLVGFPRSGTTLLDTFLMGHSGLKVLEEQRMLPEAELVVGNLLELARCTSETLQIARDAYFAELDRHVDPDFSGLIVDKLPLNMLAGPLIHSLFPDARIIFAQRHPCDCVLSCFLQSFTLNEPMASCLDIGDAADLYSKCIAVWCEALKQLPLNTRTVIYEELVESPATTLRPIVDWLGLEWRDEMLDHIQTAAGRGLISTPSYDQVTAPLTTRSRGRWKQYRRELTEVLPVLLPWAEALGYKD